MQVKIYSIYAFMPCFSLSWAANAIYFSLASVRPIPFFPSQASHLALPLKSSMPGLDNGHEVKEESKD